MESPFLALFIDNKLYGRKHMMQIGFALDFILFVTPAFAYKYLTSPAHIWAFQTIYLLSSFFNQFGPNSVTFLVAAECFPTAVRATAHGFAAAVGKLGALLASILYNYIDTQTKFYVVPWFGLLGMVLTYVFLPDTTGLDLREQERRWGFLRERREGEYCGVAVHRQHLSRWEVWRGVSANCDLERDFKMRIEELRGELEERRGGAFARGVGASGDEVGCVYEEEFREEVKAYFEDRTPRLRVIGGEKGSETGAETEKPSGCHLSKDGKRY